MIARFRLREAAGLRRFSYPVRTAFSSTAPAASMRLLEEGKPVPAQFTQRDGGLVELDFNAAMAPLEVRNYTIEEGAGPRPAAAVAVEETPASFLIRGGGGVLFDVPRNLLGFLNAARTQGLNFVRPGSFGLGLVYRDDILYRAGGVSHWGEATRAAVIKPGPLCAGLRFESTEGLRGSRTVASVVEMHFPRSKSWVEVIWTVDDPEGLVTGLLADLHLDVAGPPLLVDFGASSMVYAVLRKEPAITFDATGEGWAIDLAGERYAAGAGAPEGWAHVMDRERATAAAVAEFDQFNPPARSRIEIHAGGRLLLRRDVTRGRENTLRFWLHFVSMPVQIGAATSPQSMLSPLRVEW
ncbi:MAG: hypothetical protein ACRD44_19250 [Bryobacteraceae bacterium]